MTKQYFFLFLTLLISGCITIPDSDKRQNTAKQLAHQYGWHQQVIETSSFNLMSFVPISANKGALLTVYIEGDGLAWLSLHKPSGNPTPVNPVGLKLALNHSNAHVAYLARPCQYVVDARCEQKDWTSHRFAPEVIAASNQAIDELKHQFSARQLVLIGYSGGGAVATLLAAQRDDVIKLISVAGNLNHQAWTDFHHISPLSGSLNPANYKEQLAQIEQVHFVGEDDRIIPLSLTHDFIKDLPTSTPAKVIVVPGQTHSCCWEFQWNDLYSARD